MPAPTPALTRLAVLAVTGATALTVASCGTSNNTREATTTSAAPTSTSASPTSAAPKPPPVGKDEVEGLVRSVSGDTVELTQRDRTPATVALTPATTVTELVPAGLPDVIVGSCVDVVATGSESGPPGAAITAHSVTINPPVDGRCPPVAAPPDEVGVDGKVTAVTGNTIEVTSSDPSHTAADTVTVTDTTSYAKHAVTDRQAIQDGKCLAAQGTKTDGVLHAATVDLEPCPPLGRPHHHFYIPDLGDIPIPRIPAIPPIPEIPRIPRIPHIP